MENTYIDVSNNDNKVNIQYNVNGTVHHVHVYMNQPSAGNTAAPVVLHSTEANSAGSSGASLGSVLVQRRVSDEADQLATRVEQVVSDESKRCAPAKQTGENQNQRCVHEASKGPETVQRRMSDAANQLATRVEQVVSDEGERCAPARQSGDNKKQGCVNGDSLGPVTVKRKARGKVDQLARRMEQLARDVETCARCKVEKPMLYRYSGGLLCERCVPKGTCKIQDCLFIDMRQKCEKHMWYYCQLRTRCNICRKDVLSDSLSAHYDSAHRDITSTVGSTWRATRTSYTGCFWLVSCVAGTAVCNYWLFDTWFQLNVSIPVESGRLCNYRCLFTLTQLATGLTRTYTSDVKYDHYCDWYIVVNKNQFPSWSYEFNVSIDISKIG